MSRNFELLEQIGRQQEILGSDRRLSRRSDLGVPTPSPLLCLRKRNGGVRGKHCASIGVLPPLLPVQ